MDGKTKEQFRGIREAIQSGKVFQPMGMAAAKEKIQKHLNDNSKPEKDAARKTAEYWKAEHLAGNAIIETLNARIAELERQVVSGDYDYTVDEICNAYESGVGRRGRPTAHVNPYKPGSDLATAYAIGAVGDREAQVAAPAASRALEMLTSAALDHYTPHMVCVPSTAVPDARLIKEAADVLDHYGRGDLARDLRAIRQPAPAQDVVRDAERYRFQRDNMLCYSPKTGEWRLFDTGMRMAASGTETTYERAIDAALLAASKGEK